MVTFNIVPLNPQMVSIWLRGVPKCDFFSPSPFPYGDSPYYGYGDCVFGHPFSHALKNIFFAEASHVHTERTYHTTIQHRLHMVSYRALTLMHHRITIWRSYCNPRSIIAIPLGDHTAIPVLFLDIRLQHE